MKSKSEKSQYESQKDYTSTSVQCVDLTICQARNQSTTFMRLLHARGITCHMHVNSVPMNMDERIVSSSWQKRQLKQKH